LFAQQLAGKAATTAVESNSKPREKPHDSRSLIPCTGKTSRPVN
jgi:hypothetical protein